MFYLVLGILLIIMLIFGTMGCCVCVCVIYRQTDLPNLSVNIHVHPILWFLYMSIILIPFKFLIRISNYMYKYKPLFHTQMHAYSFKNTFIQLKMLRMFSIDKSIIYTEYFI